MQNNCLVPYTGCLKIMLTLLWEKKIHSENINCSNNLLNSLNLFTIMFNIQELVFKSTVYFLDTHFLGNSSYDSLYSGFEITDISYFCAINMLFSPCLITRSHRVSDPGNMQAIAMAHYNLSIKCGKVSLRKV